MEVSSDLPWAELAAQHAALSAADTLERLREVAAAAPAASPQEWIQEVSPPIQPTGVALTACCSCVDLLLLLFGHRFNWLGHAVCSYSALVVMY